MPGAVRFLYGLALGISLGIIGSRLMGSASSGHGKRRRYSPRPRATEQTNPEREKTAAP